MEYYSSITSNEVGTLAVMWKNPENMKPDTKGHIFCSYKIFRIGRSIKTENR